VTRIQHVHILAHGTDVGDEEDRQFGLALHKAGSTNETNAVDEKRLASALVVVDDGVARRPAVAVISACDNGSEGSPITPGASLAHSLHTSGHPLRTRLAVPSDRCWLGLPAPLLRR
jgi:hypothetical protein